jgi:hypothetical protein
MAPSLVRVDEGAGALEAGSGVDDLLAVHLTAAAFHLVLGVERKLAGCPDRLFHAWIVGATVVLRKT